MQIMSWIILCIDYMLKDDILDMLGKIKYMIKINFTFVFAFSIWLKNLNYLCDFCYISIGMCCSKDSHSTCCTS